MRLGAFFGLALMGLVSLADEGNPAAKSETSSSGSSVPAVALLSPEEQKRFEAGKNLYALVCASCHQPTGLGQDGLAPPLLDSEWVTGSTGRLVRIVLQGVTGPMTVKNKTYQLNMPPLGVLDDEQVAALLTYVRRAWTHTASTVDPTNVAKIRAETEKREESWTEKELLEVP